MNKHSEYLWNGFASCEVVGALSAYVGDPSGIVGTQGSRGRSNVHGGRACSDPRAVLSLGGGGFVGGAVSCGGRVPSSERGGGLCFACILGPCVGGSCSRGVVALWWAFFGGWLDGRSLGICIDAVGASAAFFWACGAWCVGVGGGAGVAGHWTSPLGRGWDVRCSPWLVFSLVSLVQ